MCDELSFLAFVSFIILDSGEEIDEPVDDMVTDDDFEYVDGNRFLEIKVVDGGQEVDTLNLATCGTTFKNKKLVTITKTSTLFDK